MTGACTRWELAAGSGDEGQKPGGRRLLAVRSCPDKAQTSGLRGRGGLSDHPTLLSLDFYLKLFFLNLAVLALSCGWQNLVP